VHQPLLNALDLAEGTAPPAKGDTGTITINRCPHLAALYSSISRKVPHPQSAQIRPYPDMWRDTPRGGAAFPPRPEDQGCHAAKTMSSIMGSHFPAVSAHGPRAGTIDAYVHALETGAEYVEFDIRRTSDGELAAFHDAHTPG
jgi:Glycerophosphoryl diester phosphodiesterase family